MPRRETVAETIAIYRQFLQLNDPDSVRERRQEEAAARVQRLVQREERRLARQREVQRELRRNVTIRKRALPQVHEDEVDLDDQQPPAKRRQSATRSGALDNTEALETTACGVCLRDIDNSRANSLTCGHAFCTGCIAQWTLSRAANRHRCPTCRKEMTTKEMGKTGR
eukprot:COSAG01_NODE_22331_length_860_cov_0.943495_2_plen_168_part_00